MKTTSRFTTYFIALTVLATSSTQAAEGPILKKAYRHIQTSKIPLTPNNTVDLPLLLANASAVSSNALSGLTKSSRDLYNRILVGLLKNPEDPILLKQWGSFVKSLSGSTGAVDIESLIEIIMQQAALDADLDLKAIARGLKDTLDRKKALREYKNEVDVLLANCLSLPNACDGTTLQNLRSLTSQLASEIESLNDLDELQTLRLQMLMDRRQKTYETLTNILKKMSETANGIVQNLK